MIGWLKLHRSLLSWDWISDPVTFCLFMQLLLRVNFEQKTHQGVKILPGQILTGRKKLSLESGLSEQQIRTALKKLENTKEITIKSTKHYSIISITNWKKYQDINQQPTNDQPTTNQQLTTTKERKKERKKEYMARPSDVTEKTWGDFLKHRAAKKAPVTETVVSRMRAQAQKANWQLEEALQETCARDWRGFSADWVTHKRGGTGHGYQGM